jgi:hypothetical protein
MSFFAKLCAESQKRLRAKKLAILNFVEIGEILLS